MTFRKDIQTLRAIALCAVLLFHFGVPGFASGYLGVDIFFVISGYLMALLYDPKKGPKDFYRRRASRLLPAYIATIVATLLFAYFTVILPDFRQVSEQAIYASVFASNIGFWMGESYFSKISFSPLLHLWSLAVEIQFYLFVPLILFLDRKGKYALPFMMIGSILLCAALVLASPKTSFFFMPARVWEFAIGMLAAKHSHGAGKCPRLGAGAALALPLICLVPTQPDAQNLILGHPGLLAVAASVLTAGALWGGFTFTPLQRLGNMSYSIYLAHFPALALTNYQPFSGTILGGWQAVPVTVLASLALYYGIERRRLFTWPRAALAMILILLGSVVAVPLQEQRFDDTSRKIFSALDDRAPYRCGKVFRLLNPAAETCLIWEGDGQPKGEIFLVGDSHADAIKMAFAESAGAKGYAVRFTVANDPLLNPARDWDWITRQSRGPVVLHYASGNLRRIDPRKAIVIPPTPQFRESVPKVLFELHTNGRPLPASMQIDGVPLYFDTDHLTLTGARQLRREFDAVVTKAIGDPPLLQQ